MLECLHYVHVILKIAVSPPHKGNTFAATSNLQRVLEVSLFCLDSLTLKCDLLPQLTLLISRLLEHKPYHLS